MKHTVQMNAEATHRVAGSVDVTTEGQIYTLAYVAWISDDGRIDMDEDTTAIPLDVWERCYLPFLARAREDAVDALERAQEAEQKSDADVAMDEARDGVAAIVARQDKEARGLIGLADSAAMQLGALPAVDILLADLGDALGVARDTIAAWSAEEVTGPTLGAVDDSEIANAVEILTDYYEANGPSREEAATLARRIVGGDSQVLRDRERTRTIQLKEARRELATLRSAHEENEAVIVRLQRELDDAKQQWADAEKEVQWLVGKGCELPMPEAVATLGKLIKDLGWEG